MIFKLGNVKEKRPFFSTIESMQSDWQTEIEFLDTHPSDKITPYPDKMRIYIDSCTARQSLYPWAKDVAAEMRTVFHKNHISLIKFYSFGESGASYPWHKDKMDVFLVQSQGSCLIRVENTNCENTARPFNPGDCVFIPRGTHHEITPSRSRVTYSFGVEGEPDPQSYIAI